MDQARWLVVISVIFFMFATLTLLSRLNQPSNKERLMDVVATETLQKDSAGLTSLVRSKGRRFGKGEITYSKPPEHVFAVDSESDIARNEKNMRTSGKILE